MKTASQDPIRRSPRYPFVDVGTAIDRARALWATAGANDVSLAAAWKSWGYGPSSSGGIQTEAALKQFGLIEVVGQGRQRRLKLSRLAVQIMRPGPDSSQHGESIEKAALLPQIHQHLWERWGANLPQEAQTYLIEQRGFQPKGAKALLSEYKRTMSFLHSLSTVPKSVDRARLHQQTALTNDRDGSGDFVDLRFEGDQLILSARVDRRGISKLIKLLRANQELVGGTSDDKNSMKKRASRKQK